MMSKSRIGLFEFYTSLFSTKDGPRKFSLKRAIKLFFLLPLFEVLRVTNRLFLALDNIIFPSFSSIKIEKPVMIVSMPRCGTTYLHHTLANHDETFTTMKLWELIFAPSIIQRKIWLSLAWIDKTLLLGIGAGIGLSIVRVFTNDINKHHVMELSAPEEDEISMIWYRSTAMLIILLSDAPAIKRYLDFNSLSEKDQDEWMITYKRLIQRHLFCIDPKGERRFLSKNPFFMTKSKALKKHFPDAQVISNIRNPLDSFKSSVSNTIKLIETTGTTSDETKLINELIGYFTLWQNAGRSEVPVNFKGQHINVLFPELIKNKNEKCNDLAKFLGIKEPLRWPKEGGKKHATHAKPINFSKQALERIESEFPELIILNSVKTK